ncbi:hypothetical protein CAPTEDRAFT_228965 [Capitella teleta]|uniref:Carboxylesterase type B domain-containing protein n=1 Tax=Capitella teleta TaxID=283909 RepID=R7TYU0_CAPTE|nr:hypothetical protein CAPTEDRAFT_228965 [Capitella teleta]|eukprot:ELT99093.1 hypothetical protein CAPTEDRAFT_228965 [Capitella teleta]
MGKSLNIYLYVFISARNESEYLPVVVYIHGETYEIGTGNAYDGSVMAAFGHVIVVTLNYRLGVLGFLSTGDSNAPGNYALLDQVAALHWVRENIRAFGGDPGEISLLGQGYGAAMVNLLMVSPVTRGRNLFKQAIIQSGSALSSWAISHDPLRYTLQLAEAVNCSQFWGQSAQMVQCFKSLPYEDLVRLNIQAPKYYSAWAPVIDRHSVLPDDVRTLMKSRDSLFGKTNLLLGVMKNEGFLYFPQHEVDEGVSIDRLHQIVRTYVRNIYQWHRQKIYEILLHHYTDWENPGDPSIIRDNLMEFIGDGQFIAPLVDLSRIHASTPASTFAYSFSYPSRLEAYPRWAGGVQGDDMVYVFGAPLTDGIDPFLSEFTRSEKMLSEAVLTYWCNFVRSGNPNLPLVQDSNHGGRVQNRFMELDWPLLDNDKQEFLHIGNIFLPMFIPTFQTEQNDAILPLERFMNNSNTQPTTSLSVTQWPGVFCAVSRRNGGKMASEHFGQFFPLVFPDMLAESAVLFTGMRPLIRHHMRGAKMALWLDLIPKMHQADDLDPLHHLLDNYDNLTSFEPDGTRKLDIETLNPIPPLQPETPYAPEEPSTTTTAQPTTTTTTPIPTTTTSTSTIAPTLPSWRRPTKKPNSKSRRGSQSPPTTMTTTVTPAPATGFAMDGMLSLSVTIAVGCSLLFLNILIFAGVYYQKDRMRKELKMRQREMEKEKEEEEVCVGECEHLKCSTSPETDTNSSSMMTPPIHHHMHSPSGMTTLPKHAIPVCPPQAPYNTLPRGGRARHSRTPCEHALHDGIVKHSSPNDVTEHLVNHHHHGNPSTVV